MSLPGARVCRVAWLALGLISLRALGDTTPPVDIPGLREAQAHDAAVAAIDVQLQKGEWEAARAASSVLLERSKVTWHGSLQRDLIRLAVAEARLGREEEALWHVQALRSMGGGELVDPFHEMFGPTAAKLKAMPERAYDEIPAGVEGPGARAGLTPARRTGGAVPAGNAGCTGARGPLWAHFQAVIDAHGQASQPAITGASVCYSYEILKAARSWTFEPAKRDGVPVAALYAEPINPPAGRPFREIAASAPGVPEIVTLLEAGKFPEAETRIEGQWNATLDAGSKSRPVTVTLLALRALALAAHDDPADQSRAVCLWQAAQGEVTDFYHLDLAPFGKAGQLLDPHRFGRVRSAPREDAPPGGRIERPQIVRESRKAPRQRFPASSYGATRVYIEAMIDASGAVREPLLFDREESLLGLDLEALDAVCSWRFHPAAIAGRPIAVSYVLVLNVRAADSGMPLL